MHAGGNVYREISEAQCIALLQQSIATIRAFFPGSVNYRPTVIAIPFTGPGEPEAILNRLKTLTQIIEKAKAIAKHRGYPEALPLPFPA